MAKMSRMSTNRISGFPGIASILKFLNKTKSQPLRVGFFFPLFTAGMPFLRGKKRLSWFLGSALTFYLGRVTVYYTLMVSVGSRIFLSWERRFPLWGTEGGQQEAFLSLRGAVSMDFLR